MNKSLTEIELAILRMIAKSENRSQVMGPWIDKRVLMMRFDPSQAQQVTESIENLQKIFYVTDKIQGKNSRAWSLTPQGESALDSQQNIEINTFSNISNSAIAHKSSHTIQTVEIQNLPDDIMQKVSEFDIAINEKDVSAMKMAFNYIADKSVDAAIALVTGALLR